MWIEDQRRIASIGSEQDPKAEPVMSALPARWTLLQEGGDALAEVGRAGERHGQAPFTALEVSLCCGDGRPVVSVETCPGTPSPGASC
jgi:hypothetical protein